MAPLDPMCGFEQCVSAPEVKERNRMQEKEAFVEPVVEIVVLDEDVICASSCSCPNEMPDLVAEGD